MTKEELLKRAVYARTQERDEALMECKKLRLQNLLYETTEEIADFQTKLESELKPNPTKEDVMLAMELSEEMKDILYPYDAPSCETLRDSYISEMFGLGEGTFSRYYREIEEEKNKKELEMIED